MKKLLIGFAAVALALLTGCTQIDTGNEGVDVTLGQVHDKVLPPDVYFTAFKRVIEVSTKESALKLDDLKPQTGDRATLNDLDVDVYVQTGAGMAPKIMSRFVGDVTAPAAGSHDEGSHVGVNFVTRQAKGAIFAAVANHQSKSIHQERTQLEAEIVSALQADLDQSAGKGWFFVRSANIRNLVTDPALEKSYRQAAQRQAEIDAKDKEVILAEKEADRKRAEARGDADAIRLRADAITKNGGAEYVQLEAIKKWNGVLPTNTGTTVPFVTIK